MPRLAIYHELPPGGGLRALNDFVRHLSARGHQLDIYRPEPAQATDAPDQVFPYRQRALRSTARHAVLANVGMNFYDLHRLRQVNQRAARTIDAGGYDLVFVHGSQFTQAPLVLHYLRTPALYYCQETFWRIYRFPEERVRDWRRPARSLGTVYLDQLRALDRAGIRRADLVLANSRYSQEAIAAAYGVTARVNYLGVDTELFRPLNRPTERFALTVGPVSREKGHDFLVDALARLPEAERPPLTIVANRKAGTFAEELRRQVASRGVQLTLRDGVSDTDLVELYNRAAIVLFAPRQEPFGLVPLEAGACGVPTIGVAEGGVRETIVDGHTGYLTPRDPDAFAAAMLRVLRDPDHRQLLGANALAEVTTRWAWPCRIGELEAIMHTLVEEHRATA